MRHLCGVWTSFPGCLESVTEKKLGWRRWFPAVLSWCVTGEPKPLKPWKLSDNYLPNDDDFPQLVVQGEILYR